MTGEQRGAQLFSPLRRCDSQRFSQMLATPCVCIETFGAPTEPRAASEHALIERFDERIALQPPLIASERSLELRAPLESGSELEHATHVQTMQLLSAGDSPKLRALVADERPAIQSERSLERCRLASHARFKCAFERP